MNFLKLSHVDVCICVCVCTDTWLSICGEGFKGIVCTVAYIRGLAVCLCGCVLSEKREEP